MQKLKSNFIYLIGNLFIAIFLTRFAIRNPEIFVTGEVELKIGSGLFLPLALLVAFSLFSKLRKKIKRNSDSSHSFYDLARSEQLNNFVLPFLFILLILTTFPEEILIKIPRALFSLTILLGTMFFPSGYQMYLKKINGSNYEHEIRIIEIFSIYSNFLTVYGCIYILGNLLVSDDFSFLDQLLLQVCVAMMIVLQLWQVQSIYRTNFRGDYKIKWIEKL